VNRQARQLVVGSRCLWITKVNRQSQLTLKEARGGGKAGGKGGSFASKECCSFHARRLFYPRLKYITVRSIQVRTAQAAVYSPIFISHIRKATRLMKKKLNVAMIGYQFMGRAHSNAWRQVSHFFDVPFEPVMKVIVGRNETAVTEAAAKLGWAEAATSWEEVINRPDIDLIDICSPGDAHMPQAIAAAEAKKIVFCEKPLANTLQEAEAVLAAAKKNKVIHMLCHNYRRAPAVTLAQQMIAAGELGEIYHYRGTYLQDWPVSPDMPLYWRFDKKIAGSGALGDIASHSIDLARYLVGEITEVSGLLKTFIKERPLPHDSTQKGKVTVDDAALSLVKFRNGAIGSIEGTRFALGRKNYNRFEINGSKGSLVFDLERMNELEFYEEKGVSSGFRTILATDPAHPYFKAWWPAGHIIGYEHTFTHTVYDLLQAVAHKKVPTPNFEDGVRNQRVLDAIARSAKSKSWEKV
jgi:predicted dehydrogenase